MKKQLTDVEVFVRVVDAGSYATAARALEISRSHASRMVAALEARLGVRLLHRTTRRISTTQTGQTLYETTAPLLEALGAAEARATAERDDIVGTLRVTVPASFGRLYLGRRIAEFQLRHPDLSMVLDMTDRKVDLVAEAYDVAVRGGSVDNGSLVAKRLWSFRSRLWASPAYLKEKGAPRTPAELAEHRCLIYMGSAQPRQWKLKRGETEATVNVSGPLASNASDALLAGAMAGMGIVLLPDFETAEHAPAGRIVPVLAGWETTPMHFWAVRPHRTHLPARVRAFLDFLQDLWPTPPWEGQAK
jgi:DNA-binding transcriptional LysR family regulator